MYGSTSLNMVPGTICYLPLSPLYWLLWLVGRTDGWSAGRLFGGIRFMCDFAIFSLLSDSVEIGVETRCVWSKRPLQRFGFFFLSSIERLFNMRIAFNLQSNCLYNQAYLFLYSEGFFLSYVFPRFALIKWQRKQPLNCWQFGLVSSKKDCSKKRFEWW